MKITMDMRMFVLMTIGRVDGRLMRMQWLVLIICCGCWCHRWSTSQLQVTMMILSAYPGKNEGEMVASCYSGKGCSTGWKRMLGVLCSMNGKESLNREEGKCRKLTPSLPLNHSGVYVCWKCFACEMLVAYWS